MENEITILTTELDSSTDKVIDWLKFFDNDCNIIRINKKEDLLKIENYHDKSVIFTRKYRHLLTDIAQKKINTNNKKELHQLLEDLSQYESKVIIEYLFRSERNQIIGNREPFAENKLYQLELAQKAGFTVPPTIITNKKSELIQFFNKNKNVIVKPLNNAISYIYKEELFASYTKTIDDAIINSLPDIFFTSFFQKEIKKLFEIRTFYFYEKCYSMCIFSQCDEQTSVDYRMYNIEKPSRTVPYKLTNEEEEKIIFLMKSLNLNSGSIDFIKATTGDIFFLEVNPEGQFGMVSTPCNYRIEKEISSKLLSIATK